MELDSFLRKIDEVSSAVQGMAAGDEQALHQADVLIQQLDNATEDKATRVVADRTVVNKASLSSTDSSGPVSVEQEAFMATFQKDAKERAARRAVREQEGAVIKAEGNAAFKQHDYVKAEVLYSQALSLWSDHLPLYTNRALTRLKLHRYQDALTDCDWALRLHDRHPKALHHQGTAYAALQQYKAAQASLLLARNASTGATRTAVNNTITRVTKEEQQWQATQAAAAALRNPEDVEVRQFVTLTETIVRLDTALEMHDARVVMQLDLRNPEDQQRLLNLTAACEKLGTACETATAVLNGCSANQQQLLAHVFELSVPTTFLATAHVGSLHLSAVDENVRSLMMMTTTPLLALATLYQNVVEHTIRVEGLLPHLAVQQRLCQLVSGSDGPLAKMAVRILATIAQCAANQSLVSKSVLSWI
jgi:hypothetical protein